MIGKLFICLVAGVIGATGSAAAQSLHTLPRGTKVSGNFELGAVIFPLPAGDWVLAGRGETTGTEATGIVRIANVYLVEHMGGRIARIITAQAPLRGQGSGTGWRRDRNICDRTNVFHNDSDGNFNARSASCWQVNHFVISAPNNPSEPLRDFYGWLEENRLALPKLRVVSEHYLTAPGPFLRASFAFNPEIVAIDPGSADRWDSTEWSVSQITTRPEKRAFAESMKEFARSIHAELERGLQSRLELNRFSGAKLASWPTN